MTSDLENLIASLISYQIHLVNLAKGLQSASAEPNLSLFDALPRYGAIDDRDTIWGFSKHGVGVRYIDIRTLTCVDFEVEPDDPLIFTKWRLSIFAESVGASELISQNPEALDLGASVEEVAGKPGLFRWIGLAQGAQPATLRDPGGGGG